MPSLQRPLRARRLFRPRQGATPPKHSARFPLWFPRRLIRPAIHLFQSTTLCICCPSLRILAIGSSIDCAVRPTRCRCVCPARSPSSPLFSSCLPFPSFPKRAQGALDWMILLINDREPIFPVSEPWPCSRECVCGGHRGHTLGPSKCGNLVVFRNL